MCNSDTMRIKRLSTAKRHAFDDGSDGQAVIIHDDGRIRQSCGLRRAAAGLVALAVPMAAALMLVSASVSVGPQFAAVAMLQESPTAVYAMPAVQPSGERPLNTPRTVEELLELEARTLDVALTAVPATVGLQVGGGQGSGVIVSESGIVLTAGHVSGEPGRRCQFILSDGTTLNGITLGRISSLDIGMAVIDDDNAPEPLPFAFMSTSGDIEIGTWTVATGHPGGYQVGRPPVVRVGRVNAATEELLQTDNTLVGGDSGGPLFDLDGRVIGIHSRIGDSMARNVHAPIDQFVTNWDKLADGVDEGGFNLPQWMMPDLADDGIRLELGGRPDSGDGTGGGDFKADDGRPGATVYAVVEGSPAAEAGIEEGDRILRVGSFDIETEADLLLRRSLFRQGITLTYVVDRRGESLEFDLAPGEPQGDPSGNRQDGPQFSGVLGISSPMANGGPGVAIRDVDQRGPAWEAGLRPGHIINGIRGVRVNSWDELIRLMRPLRGGDGISVTFTNEQNQTRTVLITLIERSELPSQNRP